MGWPHPGLIGKQTAREQSSIDAACDLKSETLMQLEKVHLREVAFELYTPMNQFASRKVRTGNRVQFRRNRRISGAA